MLRDQGGGALRRLHTPGSAENRRQPARSRRDPGRQISAREEKSAPLFHIPAHGLGHPCGPSAHVAGDDQIVAVPVEPAHFIGGHHLGEYGRISPRRRRPQGVRDVKRLAVHQPSARIAVDDEHTVPAAHLGREEIAIRRGKRIARQLDAPAKRALLGREYPEADLLLFHLSQRQLG